MNYAFMAKESLVRTDNNGTRAENVVVMFPGGLKTIAVMIGDTCIRVTQAPL